MLAPRLDAWVGHRVCRSDNARSLRDPRLDPSLFIYPHPGTCPFTGQLTRHTCVLTCCALCYGKDVAIASNPMQPAIDAAPLAGVRRRCDFKQSAMHRTQCSAYSTMDSTLCEKRSSTHSGSTYYLRYVFLQPCKHWLLRDDTE